MVLVLFWRGLGIGMALGAFAVVWATSDESEVFPA